MVKEDYYWLFIRDFRKGILEPGELRWVYQAVLTEREGGIKGNEYDSLLRESIIALIIGKIFLSQKPTCSVPSDIVVPQCVIEGDIQRGNGLGISFEFFLASELCHISRMDDEIRLLGKILHQLNEGIQILKSISGPYVGIGDMDELEGKCSANEE
jgi:hypothetical protein